MSDEQTAPTEPVEPASTPEVSPAAPAPAPAAAPIENLESAPAEALVEALEPVESPASPESTQSPVIESIPEVEIESQIEPKSDPKVEPEMTPEAPAMPAPKVAPEPASESDARQGPPRTQIDTSLAAARSKLVSARAKRTGIKRERMARILVRLAEARTMTNDDVQELLKVSHATATRYLSELVRQGLVRKTGRGRGIAYVLP